MQIEINKQEEKAVKLLYFLWKSIDHEGMSRTRRMGIWDEFQSKIKFAARATTAERFLEIFGRKFGISAFKRPELISVLNIEIIETVREMPRKLTLLLRNIIEIEKKEWKKKEAIKSKTEKAEAFAAARDMYKQFDEDWKMLQDEWRKDNEEV